MQKEMRLLLKSQKNDVFRWVDGRGLSPAEFRWVSVESGAGKRQYEVERLEHVSTGSFFLFDFYPNGDQYSLFSPGLDRANSSELTGTWPEQGNLVKVWLNNLKKEKEPDLWEAIRQERAIIEAASIESNENFSADEQVYIRERLGELGRYLTEVHHLDDKEHKSYVEDRLNYLAEATSRVGIKDWFLIFVGMLMNIVLEFSFSSDAARELFRFSAQLLGQLLKGYLPMQ